ncbi:MAG: hypothetical protein JXR03_01530 [Cyclobacteriaceae bacterium]
MEAYYTINAYGDYVDGEGRHAARFNGYPDGYDQQAPDSYKKLIFVKEFPDTINLDYFLIHDKDELTDVINPFNQRYFLLSPKFKSILEGFNIANHKYYPARLFHRGKFHDYFLIFLIFDYTEHLNYQKSKFGLYSKRVNLIESDRQHDIFFSDKTEYDAKWAELRKEIPFPMTVIKEERLVFNKRFDFDFFNVFSKFYITHGIYAKIIDEKITGLRIDLGDLIQDKDQVFAD